MPSCACPTKVVRSRRRGASPCRGFLNEEILEIFDLRRLLEPRAAAMAAHGLSEEALGDVLEDARSAMAAGDSERLFRA